MSFTIETDYDSLSSPLLLDGDKDIELRTIYEISKLLGSSMDLSKTLSGVLNLLSINLDTWRGMICLEEYPGELRLISATGIPPDKLRRNHFMVGEGVTGRIFKSGIPSVVPDASKEPLFLNRFGSLDDTDGKPIAFIGVPIKAARTTLGVLAIERVMVNRSTHSFDRDVRLLTMIANLIGQTVRLYRNIAAKHSQLVEEKQLLKKALQTKYSLDNVIGASKAMQEVFAEVHQSAPSRATVLLRGESGTGKEVIARSIHFLSPRKDGPFIKLNCAALSESLLETELFGHEKGAFTGAQSGRKGRFELAHGGTLFLDEIGDISPAFQAKLLRVLQEREFERVGGTQSIKVNVRLITATNRDLEQAVSKGDFRADLYYRINVVSIFIPPLRQRREDIPLLVEHFLDKFNKENGRKLTVAAEAMKKYVGCSWQGNVRELENCIERTATMVHGDVIRDVNLSCQSNKCMGQLLHFHPQAKQAEAKGTSTEDASAQSDAAPDEYQAEPSAAASAPNTERERLIWALQQCGWVQAKAARLLNISPRQMGYALMKHNIEIKKF
jgi:Nif-specific regulatory protein